MRFGVYVHIPYCLQRCVYCDFATYESSQILKPEDYVQLLEREVRTRSKYIGPRKLDTLYFGGGTPSLLKPQLLGRVLDVLRSEGFELNSNAEITLEINPATTNEESLGELADLGFNRYSVGAQTFDDNLLKIAHRKHSAQDTLNTIELLKKYHLNYTMDLLFALPTQKMDGLKRDLEIIGSFSPNHVSPYCLTVPESNPMAKGRPLEDIQVEMFSQIKESLGLLGLNRYEISNFSKPGFESRHNLLYWDDEEYWGIGLSSHSYIKWKDWGVRFWNDRNINTYTQNIEINSLPWERTDQHEVLERHQALTDYIHTALRKSAGLHLPAFEKKFGKPFFEIAGPGLAKTINLGLTEKIHDTVRLSEKGVLLSNKVFEEFTYLRGSG